MLDGELSWEFSIRNRREHFMTESESLVQLQESFVQLQVPKIYVHFSLKRVEVAGWELLARRSAILSKPSSLVEQSYSIRRCRQYAENVQCCIEENAAGFSSQWDFHLDTFHRSRVAFQVGSITVPELKPALDSLGDGRLMA